MLKEKIDTDLKNALKSGDKLTLSVLRMVVAEGKNERIRKGVDLADDDWVKLLRKQLKLRKQAIAEYEKGNRLDLADKEKSEIEVLQKYLPEGLSNEELEKIIEETITDLNASSMRDMGKVMGTVMNRVKGCVEGGNVSEIVKRKLSNG